MTLIETAARALAGWPAGFYSFVDSLRDASAATKHVSQRREFTFLKDQFSATLGKPCFAFLRDEFGRYLERRWPGWLGYGIREKTPLVPINIAAQEFGISVTMLRTCLERGELKSEYRVIGSKRRELLYRNELQHMVQQRHIGSGRDTAKRRAQAMTVRQASQALGVGDTTIQALLRGGLIRSTKANFRTYIDGASVLRLIARFEGMLSPPREKEGRLVTLDSVARGKAGFGLLRAVEAVLKGRLLPVAVKPDAVGFGRYLFLQSETAALVRAFMIDEGWLNVKAVRAILQCDFRTVIYLIERGYLRSSAPASGAKNRCRTISAESLSKFRETYAVTSMLARETGVAVRKMYLILRGHGIVPVADGPRKFVWRRVDVAATLGLLTDQICRFDSFSSSAAHPVERAWGMHKRARIKLSAADRAELEAVVANRNSPQKHVWRANIVLLTADGYGTAAIMQRTGKAKTVIWHWQERFGSAGVAGLWRDKTGARIADTAVGP